LLAHYVNVVDLLSFDNVLISRAAVDVLASFLGQADTTEAAGATNEGA
jgi:ribosomal protein L4